MKSSVLLHAMAFLLRSTFRHRAAIVMTCIMLGLMLFAVGVRLSVHTRGAGEFVRTHALIESPSLERVSLWGTLFLNAAPSPRGASPASILFSNENSRNELSTSSLAGVVLFALPFAALLIGVGLSPHASGTSYTLLSAPVRRLTLYLAHAAALLCYVIIVMAMGWILCTLMLVIAGPDGQTAKLQLIRVVVFTSLYVSVFAGIGLWFGVLFRKQLAAMLAGLLVIILLVGGLPNLGELLTETYFDVHPELVLPTLRTGDWPNDVVFQAILAVRHTPASAFHRILREIARPTPTTYNRTCSSCGVAWSSAGKIAEETIALSLALLIALLAGLVTFVRKELAES